MKLLVTAVLILVSLNANSGGGIDEKVNMHIKISGISSEAIKSGPEGITKSETKYAPYVFEAKGKKIIRICFVERGGYTYCMNPNDFMELTGR